jgi:tRNA threonylcarbamoyladenosine biosynthesis protein TsaE
MIWQTLSISSAETEKLGALLGKRLKGGETIELRADLGGGKTTFVKGLVQGAGSRANVTSPTFTLNRVYPAKNFAIHHFDFYRLSDPGILASQLSESINDDKAVVVIEWSDIVKDILPEDTISIKLNPVSTHPDERQVTISYPEKHRAVIAAIESDWQEQEP